MAGIDVNRSTAGIVLTPEQSSEIWSAAEHTSAAMQLAQRVDLPGAGVSIPIITGEPEAEWVNETDEKPVSRPKFGNKLNYGLGNKYGYGGGNKFGGGYKYGNGWGYGAAALGGMAVGLVAAGAASANAGQASAYAGECYLVRRQAVDEDGNVYIRRVRVCE